MPANKSSKTGRRVNYPEVITYRVPKGTRKKFNRACKRANKVPAEVIRGTIDRVIARHLKP